MASRRIYSLQEVIDRLGLDYNERSGKMDCFSCGAKRKIHLNFEDSVFNCPVCGNGGGVLKLFAQIAMGTDLTKGMPKENFRDVSDKLAEFMDGSDAVTRKPSSKKTKPKKPKVPIASDEQLNRAYSALLNVPALALLPVHREKLLQRGLDDEAIQRNGYRSIPEEYRIPDCYTEIYNDNGGEIRRRKEMNWITSYQICFGLMVAHSLIQQGCELKGVPGFFRFGNVWCYWCVPGILIPTRNIKKEIVIFQVRRDKLIRKDDAKYITVGARSLPGHVTEEFSRCHFPVGNAALHRDVPILVTEGPLKADVACHLYGSPVLFAAVPGVSTTKDLLRHCEMFMKAGITVVHNAFDMDRLTNPNVHKNNATLTEQFREEGITFLDMFWDPTYATSKLLMLEQIAKLRRVPLPPYVSGSSVFERLRNVTAALKDAGLFLCVKKEVNKKTEFYWNPETKGIDDYLLNCQ